MTSRFSEHDAADILRDAESKERRSKLVTPAQEDTDFTPEENLRALWDLMERLGSLAQHPPCRTPSKISGSLVL